MAEQNIFQILTDEHREAAQVMEKIASTGEDDRSDRKELLHTLMTALIPHNLAESEVLYKKLEEFPETESSVREHQEEHTSVNEMLDELSRMDEGDSDWMSKFNKIKENVEHHVDDEENEMFPAARKVLDEDQARELGERFEQEKKQAQKEVA